MSIVDHLLSNHWENYEGEAAKSLYYRGSPNFQLVQTNSMAQNQTFAEECLAEHNRLRAKHGCPPLELDDGLSRFAQEWAQHIANKNTMEHRPNNKYGENIYWASGKKVLAKNVVRNWYNEITTYDFNKGEFTPGTGHFTQVVWKSSKKVGVGIERRGNTTFVVANYDPPGNYAGQFKENVPLKRQQ